MRDRGPLYLIEILHQTTTFLALSVNFLGCILSKFYIKPQRIVRRQSSPLCCILSKFYIKPQPDEEPANDYLVVSYRNSTSNHNAGASYVGRKAVVSYRNSTSNHNYSTITELPANVVSYRNSTSNHNSQGNPRPYYPLYLIEILHQTTTQATEKVLRTCCILSKFYIKPQPRS